MTIVSRKGLPWILNGPVFLVIVVLAAWWPAPASAWWNDQWTLRKKITIDTGPSGASISDPIGASPVLVRLHIGNFRFGSAKDDGSDLRFVAADDKTPLKHHIEKYDSLLGEALIWVGVPDLKPGAKSEIWLYYGNAKAPAAVDAKGTYDQDQVLVYHFAESGTPPQDSSAWGNNAQGPATGADGAIIGRGAHLDGQSAIVLPGAPSLAVADNAEWSWSLWIKTAAPQPHAELFSRTDGANGIAIGLDNGVPYFELNNSGAKQRTPNGEALAAGAWHHLAVTAKPNQIVFYVDGNSFATLAATLPAMAGAAQLGNAGPVAPATSDSAAGVPAGPAPAGATQDPAGGAAPASPGAAPGGSGFAGDVDELEIAKVARPAGFIKFAAIGQGPDQAKLISFSVDEENAGWFSGGYFSVILRSVTIDGWVVIGLLGIMAVISWIVMYDRVSYLNRVARGNRSFLRHFRDAAADDFTALLQLDRQETDASFGGQVSAKARRVILAAPLFRLFHLAAHEIRRRFTGSEGRHLLSPQAIESIRAMLDSGFVQETQRLNRLMVMLTIAISGGPFLGLLGTVVGVMITFAAIAASGDVNVNAIAPGIAAALVATVAGLGVAIPSLFAYNYLITRIKDATSEMQVFVDELITRIAESYDKQPGDLPAQAAE
jgi:biopolymer transport protein ExbB